MTKVKAAISNHPSPAESPQTVPISESEERFRLVLEASPDGFIILRSVRDAVGEIADFIIEYTNPVAARNVNRTPEELFGQYLLHLFPDCKSNNIFDHYVTVAETGISTTFETFYDSKELAGWFRNVVVKLNDGIAVSFSNITDRKQAELALQQQQQHFRIALQTAKLGSWEHDLRTGVLTCSDQCKANFGFLPDAEFTHETLFAALHPDDRLLVQAAIERAIAERIDYEVEERCYHPDGSLHWLIVRGQLVYDSKGTPIRMVGVTLDITERKQFEESLRAANQRISNILESITDAFVAFDRDWRYTYVNQEAAQMLGRSPQELLGQRWQDVFPEAVQQNSVIVQQFERAMAEQTTVKFEAFSLLINRWVDVSLFPSSDGLAMYFRDISNRKRAEQRRDVQYAIARILAEAKTVAEATPTILQALCENLGWQVGALWSIDSHPPILRCLNYWQAANVDMQEFVEATQQMTLAQGVGLPGRVWASRQPHWICELSKDSNFPRIVLASVVGLQSGFGFPILLGNEILGVIECFSNRIQEADEDLLDMMAAIGSQIGQFMERKRTEAALQESQELFQSFMNHSPIAAFIKDESGRYLYVNAWAERANKRSQSDFIGKTDFELLPPAIAQQFHTNDVAVLTSGQPMQMLETIQHQDGEHSYMSFKFPIHNAAGQQLLAGVALDVSEQQAALRERLRAEEELRQREAELRLITNAVPVLISFVDAQQRYRFNNQRYEEWFGNPATEVYGKHLWEVLDEAAYATIRPYVEQVLAGQEVTFESKIPYKDGGTRFVTATYVPRFDHQGNVEGFVALVSDITQRKQAEETLRQSEERLRIAQQAANAGVWDWDIVANQVTWSEEYYCLYGLERATTQPSYQNWLKSIFEQDRDRVDQAARKALAHRTDLNVEFRILHPTQGERWLTAIGQTFYDDNGQPQRMTGIALDITERKTAEAASRQSEAFNREILESSGDCIKVLDLEGSLLYMNPGGKTLLCIEDITPFINSSWVKFWQEADQPAAQETLNKARTVGVGTFQGYCPTLTGEPKWWDVKVTPIKGADGQAERLLCISRDISDRKQAEEALRESQLLYQTLAEALPNLVWTLTSEGKLDYVNQQWRQALGVTIEQVNQAGWSLIVHPDDLSCILEDWEKVQAGATVTEREYRHHMADGSYRWFLARMVVIRDEQGKLLRFMGTSTDIDERKRTEDALRSSEERLALASAAAQVGTFEWNIQTNELFWTAEEEALYGLPPGSFTRQYENWRQAVHPEDRHQAEQDVQDAVVNGADLNTEFRIIHPNGDIRWLTAKGRVFYDSKNRPLRMIGMNEDITNRKQLEMEREQLLQQLETSLGQFEAVINSMSEGLLVSDAQGNVLLFNPAALVLHEYKSVEQVRRNLNDFPDTFEGYDFQGNPIPLEEWPLAKVLRGETYSNYEINIHRLDTNTRWIGSFSGTPVYDKHGKMILAIVTMHDITERKQAEAALRESEERLRLALMAASQGLYDLNVQTGDAIVSLEYALMLGYEPDEFEETNAKWRERLHPDDVAVVYQAYEDYISGKLDTYRVEFRQQTKSGDWKWILSIGKIVSWDSNGQPLRMLGTHTDITDRKHTEQILRQNEEQARLAIKIGRLGTWRYNLHTNSVELDERMREIWGEPDDTQTIPLPRVIERIHPDDREPVAIAIGAALAPESSGTYEMDYRVIWDDGSERWVSANGQVQFEGEGEYRRPIDFLGTALDITDRKQAEEALRNSAERLSVALTAAKLGDWSWNAATDIVTFSERGAEIFGIPPGPYITWTQMQSLLHEQDREQAQLRVEQAVAKQEDYDIEYRVIHLDGTLRWVAAKGRAQYDPSGQVLGMLGVVQDITARKQAEQEREQLLERERTAREQAEAANRIKDEFLAVLSHELRSPLNPILGWAKLLQTRQFDQSGTKRALETIERNAKLQIQLIDDLLDISRILRGKMMLNVCPVNLVEVVDAASETVRLSAEAKGIEIHKVVAGDIGLVSGDSGRLQQIVWNLLSNAVKFTPNGGKIEIRLEQVGTDAQIQVKDTGKGIKPEFLPHVFEYFRQEDSTTTRKFGGLGLGLAIVRYFTELHGGTVKAESLGEGLGATFTVSLPQPKHQNGGNTDADVSASAVAEASPLANLRILVVDDEADMRELIFTIFQQTGAEVRLAASAVEALEVLDVFKPDFLISDIGMPEMDGYELMRQVRSLPPENIGQIPAIALTAYAGEINQQQALAAGFLRHIAKPVEPEELLEAIVTLVK